MRRWKREDAIVAVQTLGLQGHNRAVADYWLSLWSGDRPPMRSSFNPKRLLRRMPALALMEVRPDESVRCRLAGSYSRLIYGFDMTGKDLLALTPAAQRAQRIQNVRALVMGHVITSRKPLRHDNGRVDWVEDICLPFADPAEDGSRRYLGHTNWNPVGDDWMLPTQPRRAFGIAEDQLALPID